MKNSSCPCKGSWMCREVDGVCKDCSMTEQLNRVPAWRVAVALMWGYGLALIFLWLYK